MQWPLDGTLTFKEWEVQLDSKLRKVKTNMRYDLRFIYVQAKIDFTRKGRWLLEDDG